jgi:hypothetical protein
MGWGPRALWAVWVGALVVQSFHMPEHIAQVLQKFVFGLPPHGILGEVLPGAPLRLRRPRQGRPGAAGTRRRGIPMPRLPHLRQDRLNVEAAMSALPVSILRQVASGRAPLGMLRCRGQAPSGARGKPKRGNSVEGFDKKTVPLSKLPNRGRAKSLAPHGCTNSVPRSVRQTWQLKARRWLAT